MRRVKHTSKPRYTYQHTHMNTHVHTHLDTSTHIWTHHANEEFIQTTRTIHPHTSQYIYHVTWSILMQYSTLKTRTNHGTHDYTHTHTHDYTHTHTHDYTHTHTHDYTHTHTHDITHALCVYVCHARTHTYTHTYTHTQMGLSRIPQIRKKQSSHAYYMSHVTRMNKSRHTIPIHVHTDTHTHAHTRTHTHTHALWRIPRTHTHTNTNTHTYTHTQTNTVTYTTHIHTHTRTHAHTYTHTPWRILQIRKISVACIYMSRVTRAKESCRTYQHFMSHSHTHIWHHPMGWLRLVGSIKL